MVHSAGAASALWNSIAALGQVDVNSSVSRMHHMNRFVCVVSRVSRQQRKSRANLPHFRTETEKISLLDDTDMTQVRISSVTACFQELNLA